MDGDVVTNVNLTVVNIKQSIQEELDVTTLLQAHVVLQVMVISMYIPGVSLDVVVHVDFNGYYYVLYGNVRAYQRFSMDYLCPNGRIIIYILGGVIYYLVMDTYYSKIYEKIGKDHWRRYLRETSVV